uniref:Uncharacterized protein n=1 Tax=Romanomermis culicivorax TaxID=13658 RepID=A0A915IBX8_ROMCU
MMEELCEYGLGSYITKFVSGGPKNYAYRLYSPSTDQYHHLIKIHGITLLSDAMKKSDSQEHPKMDAKSSHTFYRDKDNRILSNRTVNFPSSTCFRASSPTVSDYFRQLYVGLFILLDDKTSKHQPPIDINDRQNEKLTSLKMGESQTTCLIYASSWDANESNKNKEPASLIGKPKRSTPPSHSYRKQQNKICSEREIFFDKLSRKEPGDLCRSLREKKIKRAIPQSKKKSKKT